MKTDYSKLRRMLQVKVWIFAIANIPFCFSSILSNAKS